MKRLLPILLLISFTLACPLVHAQVLSGDNYVEFNTLPAPNSKAPVMRQFQNGTGTTWDFGTNGAVKLDVTNGPVGPQGAQGGTLPAPSTSGNVLTSNGTTWASAAPSGGGGGLTTNILDNGGFAIGQTHPSTGDITNLDFCFDRWHVWGESSTAGDIYSAVNVRSDSFFNVFGASKYSTDFENENAAAKRLGIIQYLPSSLTIPLRGQQVAFQLQGAMYGGSPVKHSATIKLALIAFTGTADNVDFGAGGGGVEDPVLDPTSTTYTAGNFFKNTSLTVVAVSSDQTVTDAAWTDMTVTGTVPADTTNLGVFAWTKNGVDSSDNEDILFCAGSLTPGTGQAFIEKTWAEELHNCQAYFLNTYLNGLGDNRTNWLAMNTIAAAGNGNLPGTIVFPVTMWKNPTVTIIDSLSAPSTGKVTDYQTGLSVGAATIGASNRVGINALTITGNDSGSAITAGDTVQFYYKADANAGL